MPIRPLAAMRVSLRPRLLTLSPLVLLLLTVFALSPASRATRQAAATSPVEGKRRRPEFVPGEVLVRYRSDKIARRQPRSAMVQSIEGRTLPVQVERFEGSDIVEGLRIARVSPDDTMAAIKALRAQPDVLYAEPNYILHADLTPNDPRFGELYGLTKIGAPQAWNTTTGSSSIVVGVIDQGIDINHPDLQANIWTNPAPGSIAGFTGDVHGYDFVNNTGTVPAEDHATHVSGTIGAVGNNNVGVVGVNWNVKLMSLRFLDSSGIGDDGDAIRACSYAKQMRDLWISSGGTKGANIRVLNNSYGGGGFTQSFLDAINALNQSGILFVAANGNDSENSDINPHYPSGYNAPNVIAVVATDSNDSLAGFSNFGAQTATVGAPGDTILSTTPNNTYSFFSGTSMASPHVAGAAALISAFNSNLTVQKLKSLLIFNGDPVPSLTGKTLTGRRLNVAKSFQALAENDVTAPGTVTSFHVNSQSGRALNLGWIAAGDDGASGQASLYQLSFTDAKTGATVPLKSVVPVASGSGQTVDVKIPYRHTTGTITLREFDNVGNEGTAASLNVSVAFTEGDPYATTLGIPAALSTGGTPLSFNCDDCFQNETLPFSFPFFGENFSSVTVSSNGSLYFPSHPAHDVPSSVGDLASFKMISGLWDDLDLRTSSRADADVYVVQPNANRIIFRWQGVPCNDNGSACTGGPPVNFEIELRSDGTIKSRYGSGNTNLFPVVGISGGEPEAYVIPSHTSEAVSTSLTNAQEVIYIPRGQMNPLDNNYFFVNQTYRDFLGREADLNGLGYWANELDKCGSDPICLVRRRTGVSAAFFVEAEFQRTGSFVYRLYKGGLGRQPNFAEFTADRSQVEEGPNLEAMKQALALAFVQRAEFVQKYAGKTTASLFVDALIASIQQNSSVDLQSQRAALISKYNTGADMNHSRAFATRDAIDNAAFVNAEYNPAFVLMQYFGYLQRNIDQGGYDHWLDVINNRAAGNYQAMVCAFITSKEYQERFSSLVPHSNQDCAFIQ